MPFLPLLLPAVYVFGGLIFCYLVVYIAEAFFNASSGSFGWIPGLNGLVRHTTTAIQQRITGVIGKAAGAYDKTVGGALANAASFVNQVARFLQAEATITLAIAQALPTLVTTKTRTIAPTIVKNITNPIAQRITKIETQVPVALPRINTRIGDLTGTVGRLWDYVRKHTAAVAGITFAGAVAVALGRMGSTWIRCNNWRRIGRAGCGLDSSLLGALLDATVLATGAISIVELAKQVQAIETDAVKAVEWFVEELG